MSDRKGSTPGPADGVYGISVAADLADLDPQSLRLYEKRGLLQPARSPGGTRLYSQDDVARLRRIAGVLADGVTLAGAGRVLDLEDDNQRLHDRNRRLAADKRRLESANADLQAENDRLRSEGLRG